MKPQEVKPEGRRLIGWVSVRAAHNVHEVDVCACSLAGKMPFVNRIVMEYVLWQSIVRKEARKNNVVHGIFFKKPIDTLGKTM